MLAPARGLKRAGEILLGRFEPEQHDAATQRIADFDRSADPLPRGAGRLPLQLPPVGLDADPIEARNDAGDRVVIDGAILARDDFDQQFAPDGARGVVQAGEFTLLARLQFLGIVGMIEAEAFDRMTDRPFDQLRAQRTAEFEIERPRAGLLHRASDPEIMIGGAKQRLAAVFAVQQHAVSGRPSATLAAASTASRLNTPIRSRDAPASSAIFSNCAR